MRNVVVYCHGYGSSKNSDKVDRLKASGYEVLAFDIDIDPRKSIPSLMHNIDMYLVDHIQEHNMNLVFVGTSLGAWYAEIMSRIYDAKAILVNPCYSPDTMLKQFGVSQEILNAYAKNGKMEFCDGNVFVVAEDDEIIDFSPVKEELQWANCIFVTTGGHRFNGPEFNIVIDQLIKMKNMGISYNG